MDTPSAADRPKILLFTDVDGTLLHGSETDQTRIERLGVLQRLARVVLVSSRTVPDLHRLSRRWHFGGDLIAENGAFTVVFDAAMIPHHEGRWSRHRGTGTRSWHLREAGEAAEAVVAAIEQALAGSAAGELFRHQILEAGQRHRWGSVRLAAAVARTPLGMTAIETLRGAGLHAAVGGRWLLVWRGPDKGEAVARYAAAVGAQFGHRPVMAAVGNAENDRTMLAAADQKWVFPDERGQHASSLAAIDGAELLGAEPAKGWDRIVRFLERFQED